MPDIDYYTSERFIWDGIVHQVIGGMEGIYAAWKRMGKVEPFLMSWPAEPILDSHGIPIEGTCLKDLPEDKSLWQKDVIAFAQKTKAYALLLVEQKAHCISVILESHHGTKSWEIPIRRSGDRLFLGSIVEKTNAQRIGLLWANGNQA